MTDLSIERLGGYAGLGPKSHVRSRGAVSTDTMSPSDKAAVDNLFTAGSVSSTLNAADGFRYRITRQSSTGPQSVEVDEHAVPASLLNSLHTELE